MSRPIRKEVYSRQRFALEQGIKLYDKMGHSLKSGNIFTCKSAIKYQQARRIYVHYANEFQINQDLPLSV